MSKLYISEYSVITRDIAGIAMQAGREPSTVDQPPITSSGTSQQSATFAADTKMVRLNCDGVVSLAFGANPTATTNSKRFGPGTEYFGVIPGQKLAVIDNV